MPPLLTAELIERCHSAAREKGFWDDEPSAGQFLMLTVGELGECLEAHRKNIWADMDLYHVAIEKVHHLNEALWLEGEQRAFKECIKDSVEDELADAYIRLLDIASGFKNDIPKLLVLKCDPSTWRLPENFGAALLAITDSICDIKRAAGSCMEADVADALTQIEVLAIREGIDLATHIDLKLRYNATRPARHGKAY